MLSYVYFFFQAEDGIRYTSVTGVQTCALPISAKVTEPCQAVAGAVTFAARAALGVTATASEPWEIGRGACRVVVINKVDRVAGNEKNVMQEGSGLEGVGERMNIIHICVNLRH